jgi:hypothetical protein
MMSRHEIGVRWTAFLALHGDLFSIALLCIMGLVCLDAYLASTFKGAGKLWIAGMITGACFLYSVQAHLAGRKIDRRVGAVINGKAIPIDPREREALRSAESNGGPDAAS